MRVDPITYLGLPDKQKKLIKSKRKEDDPELIIEAVCDTLEVSKEMLLSKSRKGDIAEARTIAIGLIIQVNVDITLKTIGRLFGGRDHSTIIYNRDLFNDLYESDKPFTKKVNKVLQFV